MVKRIYNSAKSALTLAGCLLCVVSVEAEQQMPSNDFGGIKSFFEDFKSAFNAKDVERVKKMSGDTWSHWSKALNEGKLESVEILDITTDKHTNVFSKCVAVDSKNRSYPAEVVFTLKHDGGDYAIEKMRFPESERRSNELDNGMRTIDKLIECPVL